MILICWSDCTLVLRNISRVYYVNELIIRSIYNTPVLTQAQMGFGGYRLKPSWAEDWHRWHQISDRSLQLKEAFLSWSSCHWRRTWLITIDFFRKIANIRFGIEIKVVWANKFEGLTIGTLKELGAGFRMWKNSTFHTFADIVELAQNMGDWLGGHIHRNRDLTQLLGGMVEALTARAKFKATVEGKFSKIKGAR